MLETGSPLLDLAVISYFNCTELLPQLHRRHRPELIISYHATVRPSVGNAHQWESRRALLSTAEFGTSRPGAAHCVKKEWKTIARTGVQNWHTGVDDPLILQKPQAGGKTPRLGVLFNKTPRLGFYG